VPEAADYAVGTRESDAFAAVRLRRSVYYGIAMLFTVLVLWTAFACCVALLLGYSRIPYAAARDGNFFKIFARLHPTGAFPHIALLVVGLLAVVFTFLPLMTVIDALFTTRIVVQFGGQIVALVVLRKTRPDPVRPFKMWLYPLPAAIAFGGWIFLLVPVAIVLYAGVRIGPEYMNYWKVVTAMKETATRLKSDETLRTAVITGALEKRFDTGYNSEPTVKEITVAKAEGGWSMTADYEKAVPLFGNLYLLMEFTQTVVID
jgi:amino acid transporter